MIELVIRLTQLRSLRSATGYPFMYICAFQQGQRYHMARFSRWRARVIQIPALHLQMRVQLIQSRKLKGTLELSLSA